MIEHLTRLPKALRALLFMTILATLGVLNIASLSNARQLRDGDSFALPSEVIYVPNTVQLRIMTLGYNQAAADIVWVRTLEYFARHFGTDRKYAWLEHFLNQINELDPEFHEVYHWAGANVLYGRRFTNQNVERSNHFYRAALERKPDDYEAAYRIGLNYYVEMKGTTKEQGAKYREIGLGYLERAANTPGAPRRMRKLVAAISSRLGKQQIALQYLIDMYMQSSDEEQRQILAERIDKMRRELGQSDMAIEAAAFQKAWKDFVPYVPPALYALMGRPTTLEVRDRNWHTFLSTVNVTEDEIGMREGMSK